jgi:hypothetical protein
VNWQSVRHALRELIGSMDYDLMKAVDDPEDEDSSARNWDELTDYFLKHYQAHKEES